jgi:hypothetical protein
MPNRDQRRSGGLPDKKLSVKDANGDLYEIYMSDISGKDEFEYLQLTQGIAGGLCDLFFKGEPSLVGIAGLIWAKRRKYEKKLTPQDVLETVNMASIETLELDDGTDDDEQPSDDPMRKLEEIRQLDPPGPTSFDGASGPSSPNSVPSTG